MLIAGDAVVYVCLMMLGSWCMVKSSSLTEGNADN